MELRQIPVLSKDMPTILRPGWSAQYREERERILRECEEEEEERGRREGPRREEGLEIEMEDMANVGRGESSMSEWRCGLVSGAFPIICVICALQMVFCQKVFPSLLSVVLSLQFPCRPLPEVAT